MVCCKRVLGLDSEMVKNGNFIIKYNKEKPVMIRIGHAGVTPSIINKIVMAPKFQKSFKHKQLHNNRIIIGKFPFIIF